MPAFWKARSFSPATTRHFRYQVPRFGLLAAPKPARPWPISGSPSLPGEFVLFTARRFSCLARSMESRADSGEKAAVRSVMHRALRRVGRSPPWHLALFMTCISTTTGR